MVQLYKLVGPNGECINGGSGDWPLPTDTEPGAWRSVDGPLEACRNGLHLTDRDHIDAWAGDSVAVAYAVETDGPVIDAGEKYVAQRVRLLPRKRPAPDMVAAVARYRRARVAAQRIYERVVPAGSYLAVIGTARLPAGHPLRDVPAADARTRYDAALDKARRTYERARKAALSPD